MSYFGPLYFDYFHVPKTRFLEIVLPLYDDDLNYFKRQKTYFKGLLKEDIEDLKMNRSCLGINMVQEEFLLAYNNVWMKSRK